MKMKIFSCFTLLRFHFFLFIFFSLLFVDISFSKKILFVLSEQQSFYYLTLPIANELAKRNHQIKIIGPKEIVKK